jgi:hypothetical protein
VHGLEVSGTVLLMVCWAEVASSITALVVVSQKYVQDTAMAILFLWILVLSGLVSINHFSGHLSISIFEIHLVPMLSLPSAILALTSIKVAILNQRIFSSIYVYAYHARYTFLVLFWIFISRMNLYIGKYFLYYFPILLALAVFGIVIYNRKSPSFSFLPVAKSCRLRGVFAPLVKGADIIALPFLFEFSEIAVYLVARLFSLTIEPISQILATKGTGVLAREYRSGSMQNFIGKAARLNLSIFLIGGGAALVPLAIGGIISPILQANQDQFLFFLFWCVVGQSCFNIFGFNNEVLQIMGRTLETDLVQSGLLIGFSGICLSMNDLNAQNFVILFVAMQYVAAAISAAFVAVRFGIWPGPTALFFGQIRLFQRTTNSA